MKLKKNNILLFAATLLLAACTEDFNPWEGGELIPSTVCNPSEATSGNESIGINPLKNEEGNINPYEESAVNNGVTLSTFSDSKTNAINPYDGSEGNNGVTLSTFSDSETNINPTAK